MRRHGHNPFVFLRMHALGPVLVLFCFLMAEPVGAGDMEPAAVKAAFVLNFARFTAWPEYSFADAAAPISLFVYGSQRTRKAFGSIDGQTVGSRKIRVRLMEPTDTADNCHMMFFDHDVERSVLDAMLTAVKTRPVLTVGETPDFISLGGIINIFSRNDRFQFEVVPARANRWGLKISSRLLKLAIVLDD